MNWLRKNVCFLATTLGICCFFEIVFHVTEGTRSNVTFPWGCYVPTLGVVGALLLTVGWFTRAPRE